MRTALFTAPPRFLVAPALAARAIPAAEHAARRDSLARRLDNGVTGAFGPPSATRVEIEAATARRGR